ncbi:MAG: ORF6N domain-containing protein [Desulfovibrio sp.]|jgi:hypothetical protein|nr:ORF6N domain-containing protein [Desulfovibrio sp.]
MPEKNAPFTMENVMQRIIELRGQRIMLDSDLAALYGVDTKTVIRAVKRNILRFPKDFMFQLNNGEWETLKSLDGAPNARGVRRFPPLAFTEHGILMLSTVLGSSRAREMNLLIIRTFVWLRQTVPVYQEAASDLREIIAALQRLIVSKAKKSGH